jgi:hypothetical protein
MHSNIKQNNVIIELYYVEMIKENGKKSDIQKRILYTADNIYT